VIRHSLDRVGVSCSALTGIAVVLCVSLTAPAGQTSNRGETLSPETRNLVRQAVACTGLISARNSTDSQNQAPRPRGSAVMVRSDGILVTNCHVIINTRTSRPYDELYLSLSSDGETTSIPNRYRVTLLLMNKDYDLALLRVDSDAAGKPVSKSFTFPSIELGDSKKIKLLEDLFIIGFPEKGGASVTVNRGVVEGKDILGNWIKTDARVIHGNSGGAAVNSEGRLIGIPTKVVADEQPVDTNGDGFPDDYRRYGAVGFLRPSHLVAELLAKLDTGGENNVSTSSPRLIDTTATTPSLTVRGMVKSAANGKPIAGALVGLLPLGETEVTEQTLLTWGSTNSEGAFKLNRPVPPGKYTLKAKALGKEVYSRDVEIDAGATLLIIDMTDSSPR
jgi:S1-C subfamily serine protease